MTPAPTSGSVLLKSNLISLAVTLAACALAFTQPTLGVAFLLSACAFALPATIVSGLAARDPRLTALTVRRQALVWSAAFGLSGFVYAASSALLGEVVGQSTGLILYPIAWLFAAPLTAIYALTTAALRRRALRSTRDAALL